MPASFHLQNGKATSNALRFLTFLLVPQFKLIFLTLT